MPRLSSASGWLLVISCSALLLTACDDAVTPPGGGGANGATGGSSAGTSGVPLAGSAGAQAAGTGGGGAAMAGATGQSGSANAGGTAGTSAGGAGGSATAAGGSGGSAGATAGGASSCAGALVCEDFETYTGTPAGPWTVRKNAQGSVTIDTAQHHSGAKAVKVSLSGAAAYQQAYISVDAPFPVQGNAFYGRMMFYTESAPNDGVHWTMIQGEGPVPAHQIQRAEVRYGGQHLERLMANYDSSGPKSDCWQHSQTTLPKNAWACMEWYFDGATNTQKFWLNGQAIDDLTVMNQGQGCISQETGGSWYFPDFARLYVGFESYQQDDPRDVWIDDVALGTSKLGCPP